MNRLQDSRIKFRVKISQEHEEVDDIIYRQGLSYII